MLHLNLPERLPKDNHSDLVGHSCDTKNANVNAGHDFFYKQIVYEIYFDISQKSLAVHQKNQICHFFQFFRLLLTWFNGAAPFSQKHLAKKHLAERHLAERHLVKKHFIRKRC